MDQASPVAKDSRGISRRLAAFFSPHGHNAYWYVRCKTASDPLYGAVFEELRDSTRPLLDVGCGMGVLTFYLSTRGWSAPCVGVDYDERKIKVAKAIAATNFSGNDFRFEISHAGESLPSHVGDVTILDVLQYMPREVQETLLRTCARSVAPGGSFVIRSGMRDASLRFRFTRFMDRMANVWRWMKEAPVFYPDQDFLRTTLESEGLSGDFRPLMGRTPFNNWLAVFRRPAAALAEESTS